MKLSINDSGGWRKIMDFDVKDTEQVKHAALGLLRFSAGLKFPRLQIEDARHVVLIYTADKGWYVPRWAEGVEWLP